MLYCYIRKSTDKQSYERQYQVLKDKGYINGNNCIYMEETYTGKTLKRPIFDKLLLEIKENDTIIVESLSRFSRGGFYKTIDIIKDLVEKRSINITILKENINLNAGKNMDSSTKLLLGIFSILAEFERDLLSERTKEGLNARKELGIKLGRPTNNDISITNFIKTLDLQVNFNYSINNSIKTTKFPKSTFILKQKEYRDKYNIKDKKELLSKLKEDVKCL